jgi:type I restriction enzyme S subunit
MPTSHHFNLSPQMASNSGSFEHSKLRTYIRSECVVFYTTTAPFGGLSNMASGYPIAVNGERIRTSEALYQACRFPRRPDVQQFIIEEPNPLVAKRKTVPYRHETRADWDAIRHKIMRWSIHVKLAQNYARFGELLLETGDRPIVEQSRKDDYWGAFVKEDGLLVGQNVLGRLLMELRLRLQTASTEELRVVTPLPLPDFLLFGKAVETVDSRGEAPPSQSRLL